MSALDMMNNDPINPTNWSINQNDTKQSLNYFQNKYKQYLKPSLLLPKQYYNDILNQRNPHHVTYFDKHGR